MAHLLDEALAFAVAAHDGQRRKGSQLPYVTHPIRVAALLCAAGCRDEVVVAGYLHDTVEDTDVTLETIEARFGAEVGAMVEAASEPDKSDTWENRKRHTISELRRLAPEHLWVPLADKIDNLASLRIDEMMTGPSVWERFNRPRASQVWYYSNVSQAFRERQGDASGPFARLATELAVLVNAVFPEVDT